MATPVFDPNPQMDTPSAAPETLDNPRSSSSSHANGAAPAQPSDAVQDYLDPNDPRLVSEELNVNMSGDAYAQPAPPPDAPYRVKLRLMKQKDAQGQEVDYAPRSWGRDVPQAVYVTGVEASIIDIAHPQYDGLKAFDFNVSTFRGRDNSTKVQTILAKLRRPNGKPWVEASERLTAKGWMERLVQALAGEPEAGVATQWEWSCAECGKEAKAKGEKYPKALVGMHHFPMNPDPSAIRNGMRYTHEVKCPLKDAHGYSRARVTIGRFLSLDELKAAQAAGSR